MALISPEQAAQLAIAAHAANPNAHGNSNSAAAAIQNHDHTGGAQGTQLDRSDLVGTQTASTISDFAAAVEALVITGAATPRAHSFLYMGA